MNAVARSFLKAISGSVHYLQKEYNMTVEEALESTAKDREFWAGEFLNAPIERLNWREFGDAFQIAPEKALARWEEIKLAALRYRETGQAAADTVEGQDSSPWRRARFIAIRHTLYQDWNPTGTESLLVDLMAEAYFETERWTSTMVSRLGGDYYDPEKDHFHRKFLPSMNTAQLIEQAGQQVDRWNRIFLRTLRALRDLRRSSVLPPIHINNPGQVNIGEKQVNVLP